MNETEEIANSTAEIMDVGMNCLIERLGVVEAEHFISVLIREQSDYTKWRQRYFAAVSSEDFHRAASAYGREHPL
ncbi:MAG: hypothetical protein IJQ25_04105 [Oscillibacter sp.]|nr:hypothetical protein [Oscillibacter sp.]